MTVTKRGARPKRSVRAATVFISVVSGACSSQVPPPAEVLTDVEWTHYAGDEFGTRYSPLEEIDRGNVGRLRVAWTARTGDFPAEVFDSRGHRAQDRREDGTFTEPRAGAPCGECHKVQARFEATPLMVDSVLYVSTPMNRILALDPSTGRERWTFDPVLALRPAYRRHLVSRGVSTWTDEGDPSGGRCTRRIFLATLDARLFGLDAKDGRPCQDFGESGVVDLSVRTEVGLRSAGVPNQGVTSPPAVVGDAVVVGAVMDKTIRQDGEVSAARAYDARSGRLLWSYESIPQTEAHAGWDLWDRNVAQRTGGANVWAPISSDSRSDLVFLPTGTAAPEAYGVGRPGRNDLANSVVAVRATTGDVVWWQQLVHHDLWDYDIPTQPMVVTLGSEGAGTPAVVVGTKMGMLFVFDRDTGEPLFETRERGVPASDIPGEAAWPTQPFSEELPQLHGTFLSPDSAFGTTDAERDQCRALLAGLRNEGIYTPPSTQGTLVWPGFWGGINWDGMAWDPERQLVVTTMRRLATMVQLIPREELELLSANLPPGATVGVQEGTPYGVLRRPLVSPSGVPCTPPPWGLLVAVDLVDRSILWSRPLVPYQ